MFSLFRKGKKPAEPAPAAQSAAAPAAADSAERKPTTTASGGRMVKINLTVNGKPVSADIDARTLLVQLLRENLRLTGTHVGCDTSQCGACVVHLDGRAVKSCTTLAASCDAAKVVTIEGLAQGGKLDEATVRHELEGYICRCTGYHNIVKSVLDAAGRMKVSQAAE